MNELDKPSNFSSNEMTDEYSRIRELNIKLRHNVKLTKLLYLDLFMWNGCMQCT